MKYVEVIVEVESAGGGTYSPLYDMDGFSCGIGWCIRFHREYISVFVDYTNLYNEDNAYADLFDKQVDEKITSWNFGVTYTF